MVLCVIVVCFFYLFVEYWKNMNFQFILLDDQNNQKKQLRIPSRGGPDGPDGDVLDNQESVVRIMVESPKDPPNSDFASAFPVPYVEVCSSSSISGEIIPIQSEINAPITTEAEVIVIGDDDDDNGVNEPIDVNTPRDTTNIFYAYDESEANQMNSPQTSDTAPTNQSTSTNPNESTENRIDSDPNSLNDMSS